VIDGVASIAIGVVLAAVAIYLTHQSRGLLLGRSVGKEVLQEIRDAVAKDQAVAAVAQPLTMHLGPEDVLLNLEVKFRDGLPSQDIPSAISRIENSIREKHPAITRIYIEAGAVSEKAENRESG